jgi:hypothetical protein
MVALCPLAPAMQSMRASLSHSAGFVFQLRFWGNDQVALFHPRLITFLQTFHFSRCSLGRHFTEYSLH